MKSLILFAILLLASEMPAQEIIQSDKYNGILSELYLIRQPSAKAEAMGRGQVANTESDFGSFYNPALTSLGEGINVNTSFSSPYFDQAESKFNYFGAAYTDKKIGSFGFSRFYWTLGEPIIITNEFGEELGSGDLNSTLYTLNYSREVVKDFFAGVNLGIAHMSFPAGYLSGRTNSTGSSFTLDLGLLKKINVASSINKNLVQSINIGSSIYNLTASKISIEDIAQKDALPVIFRLGGSYDLKVKGDFIFPNSNILGILMHVEYQNVLNSDYFKMFKIGQELTLGDIFVFRCGYFSQNLNDYNYPSYNASSQSQFTYGAGVKIPLSLILNSKTPLSLTIDYVNMKEASFIVYESTGNNFSTLSLNLKFIPSF